MSEQGNSKRTRRGSGAVTIRDVAKLAGVAPITVSRAVNTPQLVSREVLDKVQQAIGKTGYVPNRQAGGLASSRSRLSVAVVPTMLGSVFLEMVEALNSSLFESGYQLVLGQSGYSFDHEDALLDAVIGRRPDGIFLTGVMHSGKGRAKLIASGIPVLETWDLTASPIDMVIGFSHLKIGQDAAEFLLRKGYRRIALIHADDERAVRRAIAFTDRLASHGLSEPYVANVGSQRTIKSGREALVSILDHFPQVDAVFCSSDLLALGAIMEAAARKIDVPRQIAIMGFGDIPILQNLVPALTTVRINGTEIGRMAARLLIARAQGHPVEQRIIDVGFSIVERDSA